MKTSKATKARASKIDRLKNSYAFRKASVKAKLSVLISSQIRALSLKHVHPVSEKLIIPGACNFDLETLSDIAATFKTGLIVKFVPYSEMVSWENDYSQDDFDVIPLDKEL